MNCDKMQLMTFSQHQMGHNDIQIYQHITEVILLTPVTSDLSSGVTLRPVCVTSQSKGQIALKLIEHTDSPTWLNPLILTTPWPPL